jgi:hypothetical protein
VLQKIDDQMFLLFVKNQKLWIFLTFISEFITAFLIFLFMVVVGKIFFPNQLPKEIAEFFNKNQGLNIINTLSMIYDFNKHLILPLALFLTYSRFRTLKK